MRNKEWFPERFQAVVDAFNGTLEFVQLGSAADPKIAGAKDLRGQTTMRQSAAILYHARLYLGTVGFLMHLARAVECPSVIVYGGREAPWQSGYGCNINLYTPLPCAPCWRWNTCDFDRKCMATIASQDVVRGVEQLISRPRGPLPIDTVNVVA
jgi:ADP-heptose:LPS heptosyltransferase